MCGERESIVRLTEAFDCRKKEAELIRNRVWLNQILRGLKKVLRGAELFVSVEHEVGHRMGEVAG